MAESSFDTAFDGLVHRPPARRLAFFLSRLPVSPNHVTCASLVPAALGAFAYAKGGLGYAALGLLGFYAWSLLDHADGELARMTGAGSAFGRKLDDTCDFVASNLFLAGIFAGLVPFWNVRDGAIFTAIFGAGLVVNVAVGAFVLKAKRRPGEKAGAVAKWTDHFTGREPFYVLQAAVLAALWRPDYFKLSVAMVMFLGGLYVVPLASLAGCVWRTPVKIGSREAAPF